MNLEEIRGLADEDLAKAVEDSRDALFKLRYAQLAESVENTVKVREARKRIARIKTVQRQRELETAGAAKGT